MGRKLINRDLTFEGREEKNAVFKAKDKGGRSDEKKGRKGQSGPQTL